jgi:hypothetical protein
VPVTKVRFTIKFPTRESAVFIIPIVKLSIAMPRYMKVDAGCEAPMLSARSEAIGR